MAAVIESFDSFRTPTLFEASIAADGNPDSYFPDKMDFDRSDCFDSDSWTLFPQTQDAAESKDAFGLSADGYPYRSIATPPPSAKEAPADWLFNGNAKQENGFFSNPLHQIDTTQQTIGDARFEWGQPTPPDDHPSPASQCLPDPTDIVKQEPDAEQSESAVVAPVPTAAPSRRKKSADQGEGPTKRRRARKSMSVGSSNSDAPADPVEEERRNRFLERNRVAASKCRQKKKEWTQNLETHARDLHSNNHQLQILVNSLKDEVMYLRTEMLKHGSCDCSGIREYLSREADFLASGGSPRTPGSQKGRPTSTRESAASSPRSSIVDSIGSPHSTESTLHDSMEDSLKRKKKPAAEGTNNMACDD